MIEAQAALPEEEKDPGAIERQRSQLAETAAVIAQIPTKIENWLQELEGVMGTIEAEKAEQMEEIRESE